METGFKQNNLEYNIMNIEKLLSKEEEKSITFLNKKAFSYGRDFIEDVYCDARLKAIKSFKSYDPNRPFSSWFRRILINALNDKINSGKQEITCDYINDSMYYEMNDSMNLTVSKIIDVIETLPEKQREVMMGILNDELNGTEKEKRSPSERLLIHKARKRMQNMEIF